MKTCAELFAEKGDPWLTERERREDFAGVSPMPLSRATPKPKFFDPQRPKFPRSEQSHLAERQLRNLHAVLANLGGSRTVAPATRHWDSTVKCWIDQ